MVIAPLLPDESQRLLALDSYQLLDTLPEEAFDEITRMAAAVCQAPIALISLVDEKRQWFKSKVGLEVCETSRDIAFCTHAMAEGKDSLIVPDVRQDVRFHDNPLVTEAPHIAFYAGVPVTDAAGYALGSLCVLDTKARQLSMQQIDALRILARMVLEKMEARKEMLSFRQKEDVQAQEIRFLHQAVNASSDQLYMINPRTMKFVGFNQPAMDQLGYNRSEMLEMGPFDLNPRLRKEELQALFQEVVEEKKKGCLLKTWHQNKKGEQFPVEILLSYSEEQAGLVVAAVRNVAAKKQAEQQLKEKDLELIRVGQELKTLVEHAPLLIVKTDDSLEIDYVNDAEANRVGGSVLSLFPPVFRETAGEKLRQVLEGGELLSFQFEQECEMQKKCYHVQVKRINCQVGKTSLLLLIEDITQAKELEMEKDHLLQELRARISALQQYNYIVSHNLRGPVANILGLSDLLLNLSQHISEKEKELYLNKLYEATSKMDGVIKDLTHILALKSPLEEKRDSIDLQEMIEGTLSSLQAFIDEAQADVQVFVDPAAGTFVSNRSYVQSILYNLINNAIKHRALNRQLHVSVKVSGQSGKIVLQVSDNGQGINLHKYGDQLFGLYKRFNPYVEGRGLGLHMTKAQVDSLGGTIEVESKEGRGTTFSVHFKTEAAGSSGSDSAGEVWMEEAC